MSRLGQARQRELCESGVKKGPKDHPTPHDGNVEKISMRGRSEGHLWGINMI